MLCVHIYIYTVVGRGGGAGGASVPPFLIGGGGGNGMFMSPPHTFNPTFLFST